MTALLAGSLSTKYASSSSIRVLAIKSTEPGSGRVAPGRPGAIGAGSGGRSAGGDTRAAMAETERLRRVVRRVTCSEPWAEYALQAALEQGIRPTRGDVATVLAGRGIYPPAADTTPMLPCRCDLCRARRRHWPALLIGSNGWSLECAYENASEAQMALLPGTVSTVDLARVRRGHRVRKW